VVASSRAETKAVARARRRPGGAVDGVERSTSQQLGGTFRNIGGLSLE
jgi:hypothetical protein